jgi:hypothetical protein
MKMEMRQVSPEFGCEPEKVEFDSHEYRNILITYGGQRVDLPVGTVLQSALSLVGWTPDASNAGVTQ